MTPLKYIVNGIKTLTIVGLIAFTAYPYYQSYNDITIASNVTSTVGVENRVNRINPKTGQMESGSQIGSGVIINGEYVLTVKHLINADPSGDHKNNFFIHTSDDSEFAADLYSTSTAVIAHDGQNDTVDLMILKLKKPLLGFPAAKFSCTKPKLGETVYTIGTPQGFPFMIQFGFMAKPNLPANDKGDDRFVVDMSIFHGNSGGPVFDSHGSVVGLSDAILYWEDEFGKHPSPIALIMSPLDMCHFMDSLNIKYTT